MLKNNHINYSYLKKVVDNDSIVLFVTNVAECGCFLIPVEIFSISEFYILNLTIIWFIFIFDIRQTL